jgi:hypothetical protein
MIDELKAALAAATAPADRLALIRTITWLSGGFLELAAFGIRIGPAEIAEMTRFGLARTSGGAVRLVVNELDDMVLSAFEPARRAIPGCRAPPNQAASRIPSAMAVRRMY